MILNVFEVRFNSKRFSLRIQTFSRVDVAAREIFRFQSWNSPRDSLVAFEDVKKPSTTTFNSRDVQTAATHFVKSQFSIATFVNLSNTFVPDVPPFFHLQQEHSLEKAYKKMEEEWDSIVFNLIPVSSLLYQRAQLWIVLL